ncbi:hypothetical protein YTPLAS18_17950 [Nitrospira sp.]|nr:hypothetical protein YTPLAS18_17950 [Nitrospira sp.]
MNPGQVRAEIAISERGVLNIDFRVPKGGRAHALALLARVLPSIRQLDRTVRTVDEEQVGCDSFRK